MRAIAIAAVIVALAGPPAFAQHPDAPRLDAPHLDAKGRCRTAEGKPAKASLCASKGSAADGMKAQMTCRDASTGRIVKCTARNAVAVPAND